MQQRFKDRVDVATDEADTTEQQRRDYVLEAWRCLHDCEACGKCRILKGRDAEIVYADYINGIRTYREISLDIRDSNY